MKTGIFGCLLLIVAFSARAQPRSAADTSWIKANYYKTEQYITMRDGVRLFTAIYSPRDSSRTYPILMQRTPYSVAPYGIANYRRSLGPNPMLMREKYIFVYQDARGRYKSEGNFREMTPAIDKKSGNRDVDESSDTYDTITWLLKNTRNNGKVGQSGISFPGFYSSAALPDAHPALVAVSPQAPMSDEFIGDDCYHNGAFFLLDNFSFYSGFDGPKSENGENYKSFFNASYQDAYKYFLDFGPLKKANTSAYFSDPNSTWRQVVAHPVYDEFWQSRNIKKHLNNIKPAVLVVGGWFDAEDLYGALKTYSAIEKQSPGNNSRLVMGPWTHGGWAASSWKSFAEYQFGADVNKFFQEEIETRFFNYYLKGTGTFDQAEVTVFETGSNQWKTYDVWPPKNMQPMPLYLHSGGKLTEAAGRTESKSEYTSEPANPVPYTSVTSGHRNNKYMAEDQRFASSRPDVLSFSTDSLTKDITITGEIVANLLVSMTGSDADFIVKLIDVWPVGATLPPAREGDKPVVMDGYQQLVRAEVLRGKFRNSFSNPEPFARNKPEKVTVKLNETAHTFKKGHRIMVQVQSSWFPLVDRNPQKFMNIFEASESDFQSAGITLHQGGAEGSHVVLPVLK
ncbi:CocE/NonD family hydrolase [Dyadobacter sandarakinus]|uniref:CocE/NonD family hydrolase n=1 Tax=Dyadobacter sandarakinus TaxID=2747268 RepID=A0ABX7IDC4_9BACT|nr:CocE/NonD family hydrolase [Dyadobacter sandarakinus]QRR03703.1 CocE/NonD family hydrolase [Dyadobacter sandarakinus]